MEVPFRCTSQGVRAGDLRLWVHFADLVWGEGGRARGESILTLILRLRQERQAEEVRTPDLILGWRAWLNPTSGIGCSGAGLKAGRSAMVAAQPSAAPSPSGRAAGE